MPKLPRLNLNPIWPFWVKQPSVPPPTTAVTPVVNSNFFGMM